MRFIVTAQATISLRTAVEAKSAAGARVIAEERSIVQLCHACSEGDIDSEWVTGGELDGEPDGIEVSLARRQ
jgi:hypothetical protein